MDKSGLAVITTESPLNIPCGFILNKSTATHAKHRVSENKKRFENESAVFKNKCEKLIAMSYENNKIFVENVEKEIQLKITSLMNSY